MLTMLKKTSIREMLQAVPNTERNISTWLDSFWQRIDEALPKTPAEVIDLNQTDLNAALRAVRQLQTRIAAYDVQREVIHTEAQQVQDAIKLAFEHNSDAKRELLRQIDDLWQIMNEEYASVGAQIMGLPPREEIEQ